MVVDDMCLNCSAAHIGVFPAVPSQCLKCPHQAIAEEVEIPRSKNFRAKQSDRASGGCNSLLH